MDNTSGLLSVAVTLLVGLVAYLFRLLKTGFDEAVKTTATKAAEETMKQRYWRDELRRELEKTRGAERQEIRYRSYGALWKELRPLAIYDTTRVDKSMVRALSGKLTDWYFTETGGLLLTPQARDFYFALQDLLREAANAPQEWVADRSLATEGEQRQVLVRLLNDRKADDAIRESTAVLDYFAARDFADWEAEAAARGTSWRKGIGRLAKAWSQFDERERFAVLQQAGSILRSSLANDVESRSR